MLNEINFSFLDVCLYLILYELFSLSLVLFLILYFRQLFMQGVNSLTKEDFNKAEVLLQNITYCEHYINVLETHYCDLYYSDTYFCFDSTYKVKIPESICINVFDIIKDELQNILKRYQSEFDSLGKQ